MIFQIAMELFMLRLSNARCGQDGQLGSPRFLTGLMHLQETISTLSASLASKDTLSSRAPSFES